MANKRIYLCLAHMSEAGLEQKFVQEAFDTNWVVPQGPNVTGFEDDLTEYIGQDSNVVALASGTAAIHLALIECGVGLGDEVIAQSFTFCASSHPITYVGAKPVFVDSERDSWNMDPELLEVAINDRIAKTGRKPKAIIPVSLYGMPYNVERIMEIAAMYDIPVIEDTAEGLGSCWKGRQLGTFGKYGVLSFNGNKMITTSGGGALICHSLQAKNRIMWYATQARDSYPYYNHSVIGYNYRMSNICAGIGRGQMSVLDEHIAHHRHVQKLYEELLAGVEGITVHRQPGGMFVRNDGSEEPVYESNYWLCTITIDPALRVKGQDKVYKEVIKSAVGGAASALRFVERPTTECQPNDNVEALRVFMSDAGIETRPLWKPMHKQPVYTEKKLEAAVTDEVLPGGVTCRTYESCVAYVNGVSEELFKVGMCLPSGPCVSDDDVRYIVETIKAGIEG